MTPPVWPVRDLTRSSLGSCPKHGGAEQAGAFLGDTAGDEGCEVGHRLGESTATGGITAWRREPSAYRASTAGLARSMRSPSGAITRSTAATIASESANETVDCSRMPLRSTHISSQPLTRTSLTAVPCRPLDS